MTLEQKLQEELSRFKAINKYANKMVMEQEVPATPPADAALPPPADAAAPAPAPDAGAAPAPLDAPAPEAMDSTEEVDVTDLVNMTKNIKNELETNKQDNTAVVAKMDDVFSKLNDLESKLAQMDALLGKIDDLGNKVENMKEPTPVEKLEMRSLDSYPFSQNPQQFFALKQDQMKQSGKNEYVLTKDEIENYSRETIKDTFSPEENDEFSV